ncbi:hypothetical protein SAMN05216389_11511 [Oceanobacillus limi]|uniref:Uncharacterized protein n=1 Tax=Oceanobacillus limi TaxID=930131 RepID=A0A1I0FGZ7_9BACI|nr:hypothetical protein [Oceanobacillus limi]SET56670.1 hypothetical protein SAMN05216389_11511 [Oceanobacillus limi]
MVGQITAIILFNYLAFKTNKNLNASQIAHIWVFTIAFQMNFDIFVDVKYHGYWYFSKAVDWAGLPAHTVLIPPVNMMFINWYPFDGSLWKQIRYFIYWEIPLLIYELITLFPQPWGYFNYGWWSIWHSLAINPILLLILLVYYKKFIK